MTKYLTVLFSAILFFSCQSSVKNVTTVALDDTQMIVCDENEVNEKREMKLSELIKDLQVIRFENKEEAFFKPAWFYFSDNYICVRQEGGVVKLFNKEGKFIANVGEVGQGPGEYRYVYDIIINETEKSIYITPNVGKFILKYDLNGKYLKTIGLEERLNKGRLFIQPNSILSLVHLCFKDIDGQFTGANIQISNNDSIQYIFVEGLASNMKDVTGTKNGLNNEIWSYRNAPDFPFMMTHTDTLYHYNSKKNEIKACFTLKMNPEKKGNSFFIYNELPHHYLVLIVGENGKNILIDKKKQEAYEANIVNDFMGNIDIFPSFQDGYYFQTYEPFALKEKLEKHLASGNCPKDQIDKLRVLKETLKENDNNILLLGKLKK